MTDEKRFPIGDLMLTVSMRGILGAYAMACALGHDRMPISIAAAVARGEWLDIVAKMRGMMHADVLYRAPVVRQYCGCRVCADPVDGDPAIAARLVVRYCERHAMNAADIDDDRVHPVDGSDDHRWSELGTLARRP